MKSMNFCQIALAAICLLNFGCHKDSSSPDSVGIDDNSSSATKAYQTIDNGCDSGKHVFTASSDGDALQQYCAALQDENLNRDHSPQVAGQLGQFCPDDSRQDLFAKDCPGVFTPQYPKAEPVSPPPSSGSSSTTPTAQSPSPSPSIQVAKLISNAKSLEEITKILNLENGDMSAQYDEQTLKDIAAALKEKMNIIVESKNYAQQRLLLSFVEFRLSKYSDFANLLILKFMDSSDEGIRTIAAATELANHPSNAAALAIVRKGVSSKNDDVRFDAINSLGSFANATFDDRVSIINALNDSNDNIVRNASSSLSNMTLSDAYLPALSQILQVKNADSRFYAASIVGQIESSASSQLLISHLTDGDSNVRRNIANILSNRTLGESELAGLAKILSQGDADARFYTASLIGQINTTASSQLLVSDLTDSDSNVRRNIINILSNRTLNDAELAGLTKAFSQGDANARFYVASLLGQIHSFGSSQLLIAHMSDDDDNVRRNIVNILSNRTLTAANLDALEIQTKSANPDARFYSVGLVSSIAGTKAAEILIARLDDPNDNVQRNVENELANRTLSSANLPSLEAKLNCANVDARFYAVGLISGLNLAEGKAALRKRLAVEKDDNVTRAIQNALAD